MESRKLIAQYKGHEIRTIGDSVMAAFRSVRGSARLCPRALR
jgi:class 3 adenylate cyclase